MTCVEVVFIGVTVYDGTRNRAILCRSNSALDFKEVVW